MTRPIGPLMRPTNLLRPIRAHPATLGNVEDHPVRVLELALEVSVPFVAEVEEELAAGALDAPLRVGEVVDLEAEVVRADEAARVGDVGGLGAGAGGEIEQREIDDAVGEVDRRADVEVFAAGALELEHGLIELRRLLQVLHANRKVTQPGHRVLLARAAWQRPHALP